MSFNNTRSYNLRSMNRRNDNNVGIDPTRPSQLLNLPPELRQRILGHCFDGLAVLNDDGKVAPTNPKLWFICRTLTADLDALIPTWLPSQDCYIRVMTPEGIRFAFRLVQKFIEQAKVTKRRWRGCNLEVMWTNNGLLSKRAEPGEPLKLYTGQGAMRESEVEWLWALRTEFPTGEKVLPMHWNIPRAEREWCCIRTFRFNFNYLVEELELVDFIIRNKYDAKFEYTLDEIIEHLADKLRTRILRPLDFPYLALELYFTIEELDGFIIDDRFKAYFRKTFSFVNPSIAKDFPIDVVERGDGKLDVIMRLRTPDRSEFDIHGELPTMGHFRAPWVDDIEDWKTAWLLACRYPDALV